MAITFIGGNQTTTETVSGGEHVIVGSAGSLYATGDAVSFAFGDEGKLTVRGLVAADNDAVSVGGLAANFASIVVDETGMVVAQARGIDMTGGSILVENHGTISARAEAVVIGGDGSRVVNTGDIVSDESDGIFLLGTAATIENSGLISGKEWAVRVSGGDTTAIVNDGVIRSAGQDAMMVDGDNTAILNRGLIETSAFGAGSHAAYLFNVVNAELDNSGTLAAKDGAGLRVVFKEAGHIDIDNTGTIGGGLGSIVLAATSGAEGTTATILNAGTLTGDVTLLDGNDLYDGQDGKLFGALRMGAGDDTARGGSLSDSVDGGAGNDEITGNGGNDFLIGGLGAGTGADTLDGGAGNDQFLGGDGDDVVDGGEGNDLVYGDAGADNLEGGLGIDTLSYEGSGAGVRVNLATGLGFGGDAEGDDIAGFERLLGGALGDTLTGSAANETIHGLGGNDIVRGGAGADVLRGGEGLDTIEGGTGRDQMFGGAGADRFIFRSVADSSPDPTLCDVIRDFQTGLDKINLTPIDAKPGTAAVNDAFGWSASFTAAGQARLTTVDGNTLFEANLDADADAEFAVLIIGTGVVQGDFIL